MINTDQHVTKARLSVKSANEQSLAKISNRTNYILLMCVVSCYVFDHFMCDSRTAATYIVSANRFWPHVKVKEIKSWIYVWMAITNITTYLSINGIYIGIAFGLQ